MALTKHVHYSSPHSVRLCDSISDVLSSRVVTTDTMLQDKYFLRKGSILQISGGVMHSDAKIWGDDVDEFDPERFLNAPNGQVTSRSEKQSKSVHPAAFRGLWWRRYIVSRTTFRSSGDLGFCGDDFAEI